MLSNTPCKERCVNQCNRWVHPNTSRIIIKVEEALDRPIVTDLCNNMHQGNTKEQILHTKSPIQAMSSNSTRCHIIRKPFTDTHKPNIRCRHRSTISTRKIILIKTNNKDLNLILGRLTDRIFELTQELCKGSTTTLFSSNTNKYLISRCNRIKDPIQGTPNVMNHRYVTIHISVMSCNSATSPNVWTCNAMSSSLDTSLSVWTKVVKLSDVLSQIPSNTAESQSNTLNTNKHQQTTLTGSNKNNRGNDF